MSDRYRLKQRGFSTMEALLIVLVLVIIGGAGYMVMKRSQKPKTADSANSTQTEVVKDSVDTDKVGSTAGIDQLTTIDAQNESAIDTKYQNDEKAASTSADTTVKDVGGAYNESSL